MTQPTSAAAALLALAMLGGAGSAQTVLSTGDVLVANTDGLFHLRDGAVTRLDTAVSLGFSPTVGPAVEWQRGSDAVFVASGERLLRVTVQSIAPGQVFVDDITPTLTTAGGAAPRLLDLDVNPATGELYVLEGIESRVLGYAPPFAPGMTADFELDVGSGARAMAYDSRRFPDGFAIGTSQDVVVYATDGTTETVSLGGHNGLDVDMQLPLGVFQSSASGGSVELSTFGPTGFAFDLDVGLGCSDVARKPTDVEWDAGARYLYVLAEDGLHPLCLPAYANPNHVVRYPHVQGGPKQTEVLTPPNDSGITGAKGDLTVVQEPVGFAVPYGTASGPGAPLLDHGGGFSGEPAAGNAAFTLVWSGGPPSASNTLIVGYARAALSFVGATLWATPDALLTLPPLDANGELLLPTPIPADPTLVGLDLHLQSVHGTTGAWHTSQGLQLHLE